MKLPELFLIHGPACLYLACQPGIGYDSTAQHHLIQFRIWLGQPSEIIRSEYIPIVTDTVCAVLKSMPEHFPIRGIPVVIRAEPGMYDQPFQMILIVDIQQTVKFIRRHHAQPCLYRKLHAHNLKLLRYSAQKWIQPAGQCQEPGAFVLGHHGSWGTSQIQVHFFITIVFEYPGHGKEIFRLVGQYLRHHTKPLVVFRQDIVHLPGA